MRNGGGGVKPSSALAGVKLYIGIPTRGDVTAHFCRSLTATHALLLRLGAEVEIHFSQSSTFVDIGRNTLVAKFMGGDFTHALFIDDDMGWSPEIVVDMLSKDLEFVAAVGPKKVEAGDEYCCHINVNPDQTPIVRDGLISASHVGGAFVLLKRAAIERMVKAYPELICRAIDMEHGYHFYELKYGPNSLHTEDYVFCDRFTAAGGEIWIYPDVDFIHTGTKDYVGNYHKFLIGQPQAEDPAVAPKMSIIIVAYRAPESLERCLKSLAEHAPKGGELVIVDNTEEGIGIRGDLVTALEAKYSFQLIHDGVNHGFAKGCNIGARAATGDVLAFVNPDTVVFDGWHERLTGYLQPGVGAVGPLSNFVCGMQNIEYYEHSRIGSDDGPEWAAHAAAVSRYPSRSGYETRLLIGFFLLVPRKVWEVVGEFDERFTLGCDDLDYSMRIRSFEFKLLVALDVFVFHEGHASFVASGEPAMRMNKESEQALRDKLTATYGDDVPSSTELWGCEIFPTKHTLAEVLA